MQHTFSFSGTLQADVVKTSTVTGHPKRKLSLQQGSSCGPWEDQRCAWAVTFRKRMHGFWHKFKREHHCFYGCTVLEELPSPIWRSGTTQGMKPEYAKPSNMELENRNYQDFGKRMSSVIVWWSSHVKTVLTSIVLRKDVVRWLGHFVGSKRSPA